jgi:hypothetical protein
MKSFSLLFSLLLFSSCFFKNKDPALCIKNQLSKECVFLKIFKNKVHSFKEHKNNVLYFTSINKIELFNKSSNLKINILPKNIIHTNKKGRFKLEILIHSWENKKFNVYMVQYSFIEIKSKNLVFENAQTIYVNQSITK